MTNHQADCEQQTRAMASAVRRALAPAHAHADEGMPPHQSKIQNPKSKIARRPAFTLTELLIVVAIIAVLASLITAAAINAMRNARRARILLEMKVMAQSLETLKGDVGAFPPNVFPAGDATLALTNEEKEKNFADLRTFMAKLSSRSTERYNVETLANYGLSPAEAAVFWLMGTSSDEQRPLSGTDLAVTTIDDPDNPGTTLSNVVTIDSFKPRYDFDRNRLRISRKQDGTARVLEFRRKDNDANSAFSVLLYEYAAAGSEKPIVYFDTSRYTPYQMAGYYPTTKEFFYKDPGGPDTFVVPMKRLKQSAPTNPADQKLRQHVEYVEQRKFQLLHPGLDDAWGNFSLAQVTGTGDADIPGLLYPGGPFTGDIADTLTNYYDGPLADAQENE